MKTLKPNTFSWCKSVNRVQVYRGKRIFPFFKMVLLEIDNFAVQQWDLEKKVLWRTQWVGIGADHITSSNLSEKFDFSRFTPKWPKIVNCEIPYEDAERDNAVCLQTGEICYRSVQGVAVYRVKYILHFSPTFESISCFGRVHQD